MLSCTVSVFAGLAEDEGSPLGRETGSRVAIMEDERIGFVVVRPPRGGAVEAAPPVESRVMCYGTRADVEALQSMHWGPQETGFDPIIFREEFAWYGARFERFLIEHSLFILFTVPSLALMLGVTFSWWLTIGVLGVALWLFFRPVGLWTRYFRVVPGRLDILTFWAGRSKGSKCEMYCLRDRTVIGRMDRGYIDLGPRFGTTEPCQRVNLWFRNYRPVFQAILRGALCRAPTPSIPTDELLG